MFVTNSRIPATRPIDNSGTSAGMRERYVRNSKHDRSANRSSEWFARLSVSATALGLRYRQSLLALLITLFMLVAPGTADAVRTPAGTSIDNVASANFNIGPSAPVSMPSNQVSIITVELRTPSTIEFLNYVPFATPDEEIVPVAVTGHSPSGSDTGSFVPLPVPLPFGSTVPFDLSGPLTLNPTNIYHIGEPVFLRTTDLDQNQDTLLAETIVVTVSSAETGDSEVLLLTETGPNTGTFTGYIPSTRDAANTDNGMLSLVEDGTLTASYRDRDDGSDVSTNAALVDPFGIVFDSITGQPVNGATVTLTDMATGLPATVLGDDGVSSYPASVISGQDTTDSSGRSYDPPEGGFRFPLIAPGTYRLDITPPVDYIAPSTVPTADIQSLPGAPFAIAFGSRGEVFVVNPGPAVNIDIPVDPVRTGLWVQKEANKNQAAAGDFIAYRIRVDNFDTIDVAVDVGLTDVLPLGFNYEPGSTMINGIAAADPTISADGHTLTYTLGDLPPLGNVDISYVAEVGAGVKPGERKNTAIAEALGGITSNTATAVVQIREELLRSRSLLMGRVMVGCDKPDTELDGMQGVRLYLEDGTYVVTDKHGKYHFEGIEPGTHVVQLDLSSLPATYEAISCEDNNQFAGRNFSQFVDIQGGTMWRADFHVELRKKPRGEVSIELNGALENNLVTFSIPVQISKVPLSNLRLTTLLPEGLEYLPGSSRLDTEQLDDPIGNGPAKTYRLGDRPAGWSGTVELQAGVTDSQLDELPARAILTFNTPEQENQRTPMADNLIRVTRKPAPVTAMKFDVRPHYPTRVASFSGRDKLFFDQLAEELKNYEIDKLFAIGHTDNVRIAPENRIYFADNFALSAARANNVAKYLGQALNLPPEKIVSIGIADAAPVADNSTPEGRSLNRRVELRVEGKKIDKQRILELVKAYSGPQAVQTIGRRPGEEIAPVELIKPAPEPVKMPSFDETWLNSVNPGFEWLWPVEGQSPSIQSIKVAIKHEPKLAIKLLLNGDEVSPLAFEGTETNEQGTVAVSLWRGVGIDKGDNNFEVLFLDADGNTVKRLAQTIHYSYAPVHVELVPEESTLIADGKTPPVVAVRLTDRDGYPISSGMIGEYRVAPPYSPWIDNEDESSTFDLHVPKYKVGHNGIARIILEPTPQSGEALILLPLEEDTEEIRAWLKPAPRDWILVGFAEGTLGYNTLSGNQDNLEEAGIEDHFYEDGRIKFFAKGAIKGEWLLTLAYDSEKQNRDADSLHQIIDPDAYYPLYGDETNQNYEAASARKIYVKLERNQFYALFGDMQTGLSQTELSRYVRSMNGFKSEIQTENFEYNLFVADSRQGFVKDEIRGDGTSGRYQLSQPDLVMNSEEIVIETRDRFQSEKIINSQPLQRHVDYDIDYADGTLFFKRPVPSKDDSFNPIFIVARYETRTSDSSELNYGGRAALKTFGQKLEVGATHVHEQTQASEGDLFGVDATLKLDNKSSINFEAATTDTDDTLVKKSGEAYLAEFKHNSSHLQTTVYYRQQDETFGLGQQNGSENGTRKYGIEGTYRLSKDATVSALAYNEDNLSTGATREVVELLGEYDAERFGLSAGLRDARDILGDNSEKQSQQVLAGAHWTTADHKLTLRAAHEQSLGGNNDNTDYPTLTLLGADYRINKQVSLFAEQEFTWGDKQRTEGTRAGLKATPWRGSNAQTAVERQIGENSERIAALFGLGQTWQATEYWSFDANLDRSYTIKDSNGSYDFDTDVPATHGSDNDFTAVSLGATYQQEKWSWSNRLELRHTDTEDKYGLISGLIGQVKRGISASARYMGFLTDGQNGTEESEQELTLGLAYRPIKSRWIFLDRLDAKLDRTDSGLYDDKSWRLVNNLHANFKVNRQWQIAPYYGLKYVRENFSGTHYQGFTDLFALETRYNLNKRWDFGLHGSILHTWNSDQYDYSNGISAGYLFINNLWASIGYNFDGFRDEDFSQSNYTAKGVYLKFRLKFDQNTLEDALDWLNRQ